MIDAMFGEILVTCEKLRWTISQVSEWMGAMCNGNVALAGCFNSLVTVSQPCTICLPCCAPFLPAAA